MQEIDDVDYQQSLKKLLDKKSAQYEGETQYIKRNKLASFAIQKGFEADLVWSVVTELVDN